MFPKGYLKEHASIISIIMRVFDLLIIAISGVIAFYLIFPFPYLPINYRSGIVYGLIVSLVIYPKCGIYQVWRGSSEWNEIKAIFISWSALFLSLTGLAFLLKESAEYSRLWAVSWYALGLMLWTLERMIVRFTLRKIRKKGHNIRRIVIIGTGKTAEKTAKTLNASKWAGLLVKGFYTSDNQQNNDNEKHLTAPILGSTDNLLADLSKGDIDQVWIALPSEQAVKTHKIIQLLDATTVDIRLVPDVYQLQLLNHSVTVINDLPVINLCMSPMQGGNRLIKAIEDKTIAFLILIIISPLILIISVMIKLTSPGPVFYRQERIGWNGKPFNIIKFRSMPVDNEKLSTTWGNAKNKQTTKTGRFIRKTSLDELPQFINVLKGEMSVVGPRPERTLYVSQLKYDIPNYMKKHKVKAGITGLAQIHGWRGDTDLSKRIEYDLAYIENWSLYLDLKIIFITIFKGFISKNAY